MTTIAEIFFRRDTRGMPLGIPTRSELDERAVMRCDRADFRSVHVMSADDDQTVVDLTTNGQRYRVLERLWRLCQNGSERPSWKPGAWIDKDGVLWGERSMMIGDVVEMRGRLYMASAMGFVPVEWTTALPVA